MRSPWQRTVLHSRLSGDGGPAFASTSIILAFTPGGGVAFA
jgi:hypothetical protein